MVYVYLVANSAEHVNNRNLTSGRTLFTFVPVLYFWCRGGESLNDAASAKGIKNV